MQGKQIDLRGKRFGDRLVVGTAPTRHRQKRWYVECSCGTTDDVASKDLLAGRADRCLVCAREKSGSERAQALVGKTVGSREITAAQRTREGIFLTVRCACGFTSTVRNRALDGDFALPGQCLSCHGRTRRSDTARTNAVKLRNRDQS